MGLIPGYTYDLFVSYAHADDLRKVPPGWVHALADILEELLQDSFKHESKQPDSKVNVYWDYWTQDGEKLEPQLQKAVTESAFFMVVMSDNYVKSAWCQKEAKWFVETLTARNESPWPAVVIHLGPTEKSEMPKELADLVEDLPGFMFYDEDEVAKAGGIRGDPRFAYPNAQVNPDRRFFAEFNRLQGQLAVKLRTLFNRAPNFTSPELSGKSTSSKTHAAAEEPRHDEIGTVVLGLSTDDLKQERWRLKSALQERGVKVLDMSESLNINSLAANLEEQLEKADAFVQLLGISSDWTPEYKEGTVVLQTNVAERLEKKSFLWFDPEGTVDQILKKEKAYRQFVEKKLSEPNTLRVSLDEFADKIVDWLKTPVSPLLSPKLVPKRKIELFVDAHVKDKGLIEQLKKERVISKAGPVRCWYLSPDLDPSERDKEREKILEECDGFIIVCGQPQFRWIARQLQQVDDLNSERKKPEEKIKVAVLDGPPPSDLWFEDEDIPVLNCGAQIQSDAFRDFIEQVVRAKGIRVDDGLTTSSPPLEPEQRA